MNFAKSLTHINLQYKEAGNENFKTGDYATAVKNYSCALQNNPDDIDLLSNRSMAYIRQGIYNPALTDAEHALSINPGHSKCIYRKVKALWGLWRYEDAVNFISGLQPNRDFLDLATQADKMLTQSRGWYDTLEIRSLGDHQCHEIGQYQGPLEISQIPGKGRGYIAKERIGPGQVIQCTKAFAITFSDEPQEGCYIDHRASQALVQTICEKLSQDNTLRGEFARLYSASKSKNPSWIWSDSEDPSTEEEMIFEVRERIINNSFAGDDPNFTGLWMLASYFNHDCIDANTHWIFRGDIMLIRAAKEILPGEEVVIYYNAPNDPDRLVELMDTHKFCCQCRLCLFEKSEPPSIKVSIDSVLESIRTDLKAKKPNLDTLLTRVKMLMSLREGRSTTLNMALLDDSVDQVSLRLYGEMRFVDAVHILKARRKVLETPCHVENLVQKDMTIVSCYIHLGIRDEVRHWTLVMREDLIRAYGSVEYIKEVGQSFLKDLEEFGELNLLDY